MDISLAVACMGIIGFVCYMWGFNNGVDFCKTNFLFLLKQLKKDDNLFNDEKPEHPERLDDGEEWKDGDKPFGEPW